MTAAVSHLLQQALQLSADMRLDLAEHLMESTAPSSELVAGQMETIRARMANVGSGASSLVAAEEAHQFVRDALASRA